MIAAGRCWAMELEGKTAYVWAMYVQNTYEGTCSKVVKKAGDSVAEKEILGFYRLTPAARNSIIQALDDGELRAKQAEARVLDARLAEARVKVKGLGDAVAAGVESRAGLDVAAAELGLLETQRQVIDGEIQDITTHLQDERTRINDELGGIKVSRGNVPWEVPLRAPFAGVVVEQTAVSGVRLEKKANCFRVAPKSLYVKCQVYAEDYIHLKEGDEATISIPQYPDRTFPATLVILPLTPLDKGFAALSVYEVYFQIADKDMFVSEGVRVTVHLAK